MITLSLSKETRTLKPYISELLLYSGISHAHVEVGKEQTRFGENVIFVQEDAGDSLEDILSKLALKIYDPKIHKSFQKLSETSLIYKHGKQAHIVASVLEKAIEPIVFFGLDRVRV